MGAAFLSTEYLSERFKWTEDFRGKWKNERYKRLYPIQLLNPNILAFRYKTRYAKVRPEWNKDADFVVRIL